MKIDIMSNYNIDRNTSELLFRSIIEQDNVFYKHQTRDEPELEFNEKLEILRNLFENKPVVFLQRYHQFISPCFKDLFDDSDYVINYYLKLIKERIDAKIPGTKASKKARNQRYLQMMKLKNDTNYFTNEKMRERAPALFDSMIGQYLSDEEKLYLRPTVERPVGVWPDLLEQLDDAGRIARRKRQMSNDWEMPCSSKESARFVSHAGTRIMQLDELETIHGLDIKDEEALRETFPKHYAKEDVDSIMKKFKKTNMEAENKDEDEKLEASSSQQWGGFVDEKQNTSKRRSFEDDDNSHIEFSEGIGEQDDSDNPDSDIDEYSSELLKSEFMSIMERRFLNGEDLEFFDYSKEEIDDKIREQDIEDAYFAEDDNDEGQINTKE